MRIIQKLEFDHCSITHASYEGGLHMAPHTDAESKISIILNGSLLEKTNTGFVEAKRNSVVIKPDDAVHENAFGHKGVSLMSISFRKDFSLPDNLKHWHWFEDPRVSYSTYKLWFSIKSVKNDRQLNQHLEAFIKAISVENKVQQNAIPTWLPKVQELLKQYSFDGDHIDEISYKLGISRGHLSRSFKKQYTISPVNYRHFVRMNNLLYCLSSSDKSLAEIAYECGFSDQSQMSRIVLKETGFTPHSLRMLLQKA